MVGNMNHTFDLENIQFDKDDLFAGLVSVVAFVIQFTYQTTLQATSLQLMFGKGMIFPIQHIVD